MVHPDLKALLDLLQKYYPQVRILETVRTPEKQAEYVKKGLSKTLDSKHLIQRDGYCHAADILPHNRKDVWQDREAFIFMAGYMKGAADARYDLGESAHRLRVGADWNNNMRPTDEKFFDGPHVELV